MDSILNTMRQSFGQDSRAKIDDKELAVLVNPKMTLKDYQRAGINWMLQNSSGILADEMVIIKIL